MTWRGKLKAFAPQVAETGAAIAGWTLMASLHSTPAMVAVGLTSGVLSLVAIVTTIIKAAGVCDHGWDRYLTGGCDGCNKWKVYSDKLTAQHNAKLEALTKENDKLTHALLTD